MRFADIIRMLTTDTTTLDSLNGLLDLSEMHPSEISHIIPYLLDKPKIHEKIKTIKVNITNDENLSILKLIAKCNSLSGIIVVSLNYNNWKFPSELSVLSAIYDILKNKNLKTLVLDNCKTYSHMTEHSPKAIEAMANHFESIKITNLILKDAACDGFIDNLGSYGTKKLKHLTLENITFNWDKNDKALAEKYTGLLKKKLIDLKHHSSLKTLIVKNISMLDDDFCSSLAITPSSSSSSSKTVQPLTPTHNNRLPIGLLWESKGESNPPTLLSGKEESNPEITHDMATLSLQPK